MNLFDLIEPPEKKHDWRPEPPPVIPADVKEIFINFETTGVRWWKQDMPIGAGVAYGDKSWFLPWKFSGGNLDEGQCKEFFKGIKGKRIINTRTKFDLHMGLNWGVNFEEQGNQVVDVSHYAALLDDHRKRFSLDVLINDFLGHPPTVPRLDESRMSSYHAGEEQARARYQVTVVQELYAKMRPQLTARGLDKVRVLEEELIHAVVEMERNGEKIDVEKVERWDKEAVKDMEAIFWKIYKETGIKVLPDDNAAMTELFRKLGIPIGGTTSKGKASFTDLILKQIEHPLIKDLRRAKRLKSLRSKYWQKYLRNVDSNGIIRYSLHQLKEVRDSSTADYEAGEAGVGFGRFSSTGLSETEGTNIQQTIKVDSQKKIYGDKYIVRETHIPGTPGYEYLSADAMQIEYRIHVHESNDPKTIQAYKDDPDMSFHRYMHEIIKKYQPDFSYRQQKDLNFAKIYGAGIKKLAFMLEFITKEQFLRLVAEDAPSTHPDLAKALEINEIYNRVLPGAKPLNDRAMNIARTRGVIRTILGRCATFPGGEDIHKALNRRIQGSASDIMKAKIVELRKFVKETCFVLRYPVHDSVNGDIPDKHHAEKVRGILNRQIFPLKVPIRWDLKTGPNWRACGDD
jgi:DNA polymerase-1